MRAKPTARVNQNLLFPQRSPPFFFLLIFYDHARRIRGILPFSLRRLEESRSIIIIAFSIEKNQVREWKELNATWPVNSISRISDRSPSLPPARSNSELRRIRPVFA